MIQGVIQRLIIVQQSEGRLLLREYPLLDWGIAFALFTLALALSVANFLVSAVIAGGIGIYFLLTGRVRTIDFDTSRGKILTSYQTPISNQAVSDIPLDDIQHAYLLKGDDAGTQIILVRTDGEELGISVYSNDIASWKDDIVIAINAVLFTAHQQSNDDSFEE